MGLIYYASPVYVDYLYRALVSEVGSRTITTGSNATASASANMGLAQLLTALGQLGGTGSIDLLRTKSETLEVQQSVFDRAAALLNALTKKKKLVPSISEYRDGLCWYSLPTGLASKKREEETVIEVSCKSHGLTFSGITSAEHWGSVSLRNNLLVAAAKSEKRTVPTFGIVLPLHTNSSNGRMTMQVQFIIIASQDTWKP